MRPERALHEGVRSGDQVETALLSGQVREPDLEGDVSKGLEMLKNNEPSIEEARAALLNIYDQSPEVGVDHSDHQRLRDEAVLDDGFLLVIEVLHRCELLTVEEERELLGRVK